MTVDSSMIDRFLDGEASPQECKMLEDWLQSPSNRHAYIARVDLHVNLRRSLKRREIQDAALSSCNDSEIVASLENKHAASDAEPKPSDLRGIDRLPAKRFGTRSRLALAVAVLATAAMLASALLRHAPDRSQPNTLEVPLGVATVAYQSNASWSGNDLNRGDALDRGLLQLDVGIARLDFSNGASVTLQGPAQFEILSSDETRLHHGILTAQIPPNAIGFQVFTPAVDVLDLGTAFGVAVAANGETDVCVFEGEVEVSQRRDQTAPAQRLREGSAIHAASRAESIESVSYETIQFEDGWPVTSGVLQATGLMKFVSPGPNFVPGRFEDNEHILVFPERSRVTLSDDAMVDLTEPGLYQRIHPRKRLRIDAGQKVRSYLLQLDPLSQTPGESFNRSRVVGQITFDHAILGLIVRSQKLNATDAMLGHPMGDYGKARRGIEPPEPSTAQKLGRDQVVLSPDRRTLSVDLSAAMAVDQIRVIVSETE